MEKFLENWESFLNEIEAAPKAAVKSLKKFRDDMLGGGAKSSAPFTKDGFPKDFNKPEEFSAPPMEENQEIDEHIVKKGNKYCLMSKKSNKNLGCYPSKAGAQKRERQVQYFKHMKEGEVEEDILFKPLSKSQRAHSSKLIRIKYKDRPMDADGIIDPKKAKEELEEKKDRCYNIAKRKYKAFPSAYACVPENSSKALTREGWKTVEEISIGEEILTFNMRKDELEFKPILNVHRYKNAPTQIVRSGNNGFIFESTSNHKWVVKLPETVSERKNKYNRINDMALIETSDLLENKNNKLLVVSAPYKNENNIIKNKIYKYGDNWIKYLLEASSAQRQAWLFSAIVYDGNQQKVERLTENKQEKEKLEWKYDGKNDKQTFGFKQKDIMHRDAFLLSAFLNEGLVAWKKAKDKEIYSCHYSSNKRYKNAANLKTTSENITDVWCPETENNTWVMMQETNGQGIITITGNSGAIVKCRQGKIWKKEK